MKLIVASAFAVGLGLMVTSAQAMPVVPVDRSAPDQIIRATYDQGHRRAEARFVEPDGKLRGVSTYKRDRAGNVVQEDEWLNDPTGPHAVSTYAYTFDAHGNWTERRQTRTGVSDDNDDYGLVGTLVRTITYYGD